MKVLVRPDEALEAQIDEAYYAMLAATDDAERSRQCRLMSELIGKRSPTKVKRMEA
jgi:hypothetical protein